MIKGKLLVLMCLMSTASYATTTLTEGPNSKEDFLRWVTSQNRTQDQVVGKLRAFIDEVPTDQERIDVIKGCVTKTICSGTGKERTCESWSFCVEN